MTFSQLYRVAWQRFKRIEKQLLGDLNYWRRNFFESGMNKIMKNVFNVTVKGKNTIFLLSLSFSFILKWILFKKIHHNPFIFWVLNESIYNCNYQFLFFLTISFFENHFRIFDIRLLFNWYEMIWFKIIIMHIFNF